MKKTLIMGALGVLMSFPVMAASWPTEKTIRIVHGFSAAAATQMLAQDIAEQLHAKVGATVYVEPRPGAGGNIGADVVAKSAPDGYTLYVATSATQAINPLIYRKLPFDTQKDFAPISILGDVPNVLIVNKNLPVNTLADFVALAKSQPGKLHYGSSGNGTSMHLAAEQFKMTAGVDIQHVPYRSSGTAVTDLMGGQIDAMFHQVPAVIGMIQSQNLKALAVTTRERVEALPDVPTVGETYPGFESMTWYGLFAPAGTPEAIVQQVNQVVTAALKGDLGRKLLAIGITPRPSSPEQTAAAVSSDSAHWKVVVDRVGVHLD
ncbi:Bug family tripartite tricarboxylate transporter substrate binding protein [Bordetella genomosp. 4]|uniref:Bug family tripartite tricarboxylate transporter substrate binding protein n=1 Tax=Bordetella genomosp. 4 TaxID=463044 RepID=UPI000B9DDEEC|nr:tripartite tricarboxylate transporter substrate binding protein [Bordetella genomosp. 4]OZI51398.1 hypothetical protein CAL21_05670 [Bordetella genomosp. 4]